MRNALFVLSVLLCSTNPAAAQVSVDVEVPGVSIGINLPVYPQLVAVPDYPVYYAPQVNANYFFYDGMYWVYQRDNWYASSWYNGPWQVVAPAIVPLFVLRVPVHYYRQPPTYFRAWSSDAPPRWGEHWGSAWQQSHDGWDNWNRNSVPALAPLPAYQRQYSGNRYPVAAQQQALQSRNYQYQPHDAVVQQHYQTQRTQGQTASAPPASNSALRAQAGPAQGGSSPPIQHAAAPAPRRQPPKSEGPIAQSPAGAPAPAQHATAQPSRGQPPQKGADAQKPVANAVSPQRVAAPAPRAQPQKKEGGEGMRPAAVGAPPAHVVAQAPRGQPTQAAPQRGQQAAKAQGENKGPQGNARAEEPRQGPEKEGERR